jgi:cell division protein FtsI/penicillin-binding protein 2
MFATVFAGLAANGRARRRARNLRAGAVPGVPAVCAVPGRAAMRWWLALAALGFVVAGAVLIAGHARSLGAAAASRSAAGSGPVRTLAAFQPALPGASFGVPLVPAVNLAAQPGGALLVVANVRAARPVVIDLCSQALAGAGGRLAPLRIGYRFADVARWAGRNATAASPVTLRNIVLAGGPMPQVDISGSLGMSLQLAWRGEARWIGDASAGAIARGPQGAVALGREGWLVWGENRALHIARRASAACAEGGELVLTSYPGEAGSAGALVAGFPEHGPMRSAYLAPGDYRVPSDPPAELEDGALFDSLLARGFVRLAPKGMIETVPRDLLQWRAADPAQRAADLHGWDGVVLDARGLRLLERLHARADGAYVREQIRVFNGERRLLAWRLRPGASATWLAQAGAVAAGTVETMPLGAARLFDSLPQGWAPWRRLADWPAGATSARLVLTLAQPARGDERIELMLAGRVRTIAGAALSGGRAVCGGRACTGADDVRELVLAPRPGTRQVVIEATPLDLAALNGSGDGPYRHLQVKDGRLAWQAIAPLHRATPGVAAAVLLADRDGAPLWEAGGATAEARAAGLSTLLGLNPQHGSSVAGMLARVPAPDGRPHAATLTLDLGLQRAAQAVLDCVGVRRGQWDGARCLGGAAPPAGRQAGLVLLDTGSGDILAAASSAAGASPAAANWNELRDFDRVDPARSPLRQAAFQHDGGAERSPGSTFKIVSALGLELAAQRDPRLDDLLGGMPLADLNRFAAARGFAFRTDGATYPYNGHGARITNFRDGTLDRRAQDGKLGLAQALTWSLNTWFAWSAELSDASLFGKAQGGAPSLRALDDTAFTGVRPIAEMAQRLGFERPLPLDGGLLPPDFAWRNWDALQASVAGFDPIGSRHELRQMAIGLRMQATPLHMALAAGAVGEGRAIAPRLLLALDGRRAAAQQGAPLGVRLDRIRAGLHGVVAKGTAASAFRAAQFDGMRPGLYGKTGTAPVGQDGQATVWFTGWLEPGSIPGQTRRLAFAAFVSRSEATGGEHAAPVVAAMLRTMAQKAEQKG